MKVQTTAQRWARGLAWFGIGLGALECIRPRAMARATGLEGKHRLVQIFGAREILSGVLILNARDPEEATWVRVLGDVLDAALLTRAAVSPTNPHKGRTIAAAAAVAPVVLMDYIVASKTPASR